MTARGKPMKTAGEPLGERIGAALESGQTLRCDLGRGARLHVDRPLPFIVIHRLGQVADAARAIVAANASYLLFRNQGQAREIIAQVGAAMSEKFGAFLVIEIAELEKDTLAEDADYLPLFEIELAASERTIRPRRRSGHWLAPFRPSTPSFACHRYRNLRWIRKKAVVPSLHASPIIARSA